MTKRHVMALVFVCVVLASRFAHLNLVWIEEAYGMAAGAEVLRGKALYRDVWFDKPPLYALFYAATSVHPGIVLRLAGSGVVLGSCALAFAIGRRLWSEREGVLAAGLLGVSLVFWIPSAVIAVAPDLLMLIPHLGAVYLAIAGRPVASGVLAGVAMLCNSKGLIVLGAAALFAPGGAFSLVLGWTAVQALSAAALPAKEYWTQVWTWGFRYAQDTFVAHPILEGVRRTVNWAGFHAAAMVGAAVFLKRGASWRLILWLALGLMAVVGGLRFFPRYYFAVLPPVVLMGARGLCLLQSRSRIAALLLLAAPVVRFAPGYVRAALGPYEGWSDVALMEESRRAALWLEGQARPGDQLLVWGYRPDVYVFSGLAAGTRFLDSQPLTGVLADRHLSQSRPTFPQAAEENRNELLRTRPTFLVDGLGPLNPNLRVGAYADLRGWLSQYEEAWRGATIVVYRMRQR